MKHHTSNLRKLRRSVHWICANPRHTLSAAVLLIGILGIITQLLIHATTTPVNVEPESGTIYGAGGKRVTDGTASGNGAIKFGYAPAAVGSYKPSAATTGYAPYAMTLKPYTGQLGAISGGVLTITQPNTVISGYDIPARIVVKANNVVIQKSLIRGDSTTLNSDHALVECTVSPLSGCVVQDSVLRPDNPSLYWNGIRGHDFVAQRNEIYSVTDGIDIFNAASSGATLNVVIAANYIHDLTMYGPDFPNNRPNTHNDCIQWVGGNTVVIRGNNLQGFLNPSVGQAKTSQSNPNVAKVQNGTTMNGYNPSYPKMNANSVLQVTQPYGPARNLVFDKNWIGGGSAALNFAVSGDNAGVVGTITNNLFSRDQLYGSGDTSLTILSHGGLTFNKPGLPLMADSTDPSRKNTGPGTYDSAANGNNIYENDGTPIYIRQYSN